MSKSTSSSSILRNFDHDYEKMLKNIPPVSSPSFSKPTQVIPRFLQEYSTLCRTKISNTTAETRFIILSKLRGFCITVLRHFPETIDSQGLIRDFFHRDEKLKSDEPQSIDIGQIIIDLQTFKSVRDVTEIDDSIGFYYYTILEYYILISNNLAYACLEREDFDLALVTTMKILECWRLLQYSSYFLKYQISTVLINLVSLIEDENKMESSQLLCNVILHLENLETEIDQDAESFQIFEHLSERSSHFMFLLKPKDETQSFAQPQFLFKKSFLLARMCMVYAYYADFLITLDKKVEGDFARKHANMLKKELEKKERLTQSALNTPKRSIESSTKSQQPWQSVTRSGVPSASNTMMMASSTAGSSPGHTKISRENILFQKYLEIEEGTKYRVIVANLTILKCVEVVAYDKPQNKLTRIFIHFKDLLQMAQIEHRDLSSEKDMKELLNSLTKLLYIDNGLLSVHEIPFFRDLGEQQLTDAIQ